MHRSTLNRSGLIRSGLVRSGLVRALISIFDKLKNLSQPLIVAYEGDDPEVTGRYPLEATVLELDAAQIQHVNTDYVLDVTRPFEASIYFKTSDTSQTGYVIYQGLNSTNDSKEFMVLFTGGIMSVLVGTGTSAVQSVGTVNEFVDGEWHKVKFISDGSDYIIYVDGVNRGGKPVGLPYSTETSVLIGCRRNGSTDPSSRTTAYGGLVGSVEFKQTDNNAKYLLNETSGTTAIDSSVINSPNNGTLVNGASWVVDNDRPVIDDKGRSITGNPANWYGYTLGDGTNGAAVGVIIPAVTPTLDAFGNTLQFQGSVFPIKPAVKGNSVLSFDGVDQYVSTNVTPQSQGDLYGWVRNTHSGVISVFAGSYSTSDVGGRWYIYQDANGILNGAIGGQTGAIIYGGDPINDGEWHHVKLTHNGSTVKLFRDFVEVYSGVQTSQVAGTEPAYLGCRNFGGVAANFYNGELWNFTINSSVYPFTEGDGTAVTDVSGNGNHGTIVNGATWVQTLDGRSNAYNLNNGFTLYENGANLLRIPYADGSPVSNPVIEAGYTFVSENPAITDGHNNAESTEDAYNVTIDGNPVGETINLANFADIEFADLRADLITTTPVDAVFRRDISEVSKDRLIAYYDTLTGSDKDLAISYTDPPPIPFSPSLSFDDGRNSQYLPLI